MKGSAFRWLLAAGRGPGLRAQLVRAALSVGGLNLLSIPLTLAASILLARGLGPEGYGQYVFVMAVISILVVPFGPGVRELVTREVARYEHGEQWSLYRGLLRRVHQWVFLGSVLMIGGIAFVSSRSASWMADDTWSLLLIGSFMLPLLGLNTLRNSTLRGLRYVFQAQLSEQLASPGFHILFVGVLFLFGMLNPASALSSQVAATAIAFLLGAWLLNHYQPKEVKEVKPAYRHSEWGKALFPFILLAAVGTLNGQIGILVLGWLGGEEDVAALRVAQSGAMLVALSLTIVNLVIGPHVTRAHKDGNKVRLQMLSRQSARAALAVAFPIAMPLIFFGGPIIQLVYGEAYANMAVWPLVILAVGQLVNVAFGSVGLILAMTGYERDTLTGQLVALVISFFASLILIPLLGVIGAALAVSIGLLTWNLVLAIMLFKRLQLRPSAL